MEFIGTIPIGDKAGKEKSLTKLCPVLWIRMLTLLSFSWTLAAPRVRAQAHPPSLTCHQSLQRTEGALALKINRVLSEGTATFTEVLILKSEDFDLAETNHRLTPQTLLVMDQFPTTKDLPLVAGLLIVKPFPLEFTHVQMMAEKLRIPILQIPTSTKKQIEEYIRETRSPQYQMIWENSVWKISSSIKGDQESPSLQSVLPYEGPRKIQKLFTDDYPESFCEVEVCGEKYLRLREFQSAFPHLTPKMIAVSSGYYETFLTYFHYQGQTLRHLQRRMAEKIERAESQGDPTTVRKELQFFREAILQSQPSSAWTEDLFKTLLLDLSALYGPDLYRPFSVRSNNDIEEVLGHGLYQSLRVPQLNLLTLESSLKTIWASLFDDRAYSIRKRWGVLDSRLSMPVLLHPFIEDIQAHGVSSIDLDELGQVEMHVSMVLDKKERATNPSPGAKALELYVKKDRLGLTGVWNISENPAKGLSPEIRFALIEFFKETEVFFKNEISGRKYQPQLIYVEFVLETPVKPWLPYGIKVLQYKPSFSQEIYYSLHQGLIHRRDLDRKLESDQAKKPLETQLEHLGLRRLHHWDPLRSDRSHDIALPGGLMDSSIGSPSEPILPSFLKKKEGMKFRFALLLKENRPLLIIWDDGRFHQAIHRQLTQSEATWVKSGYLDMSRSSKGWHWTLTPSRYSKSLDHAMTLKSLTQLFKDALQGELSEGLLSDITPLQDPSAEGESQVISVDFRFNEGDGAFTLPSFETDDSSSVERVH